MDILTGLSVIVVSSGYLAFIILELLKARWRTPRRAVGVASATSHKRQRRDGFVVEDDYPPNANGKS